MSSREGRDKVHNDTLNVYRNSVLHPLLRVTTSSELRSDVGVD